MEKLSSWFAYNYLQVNEDKIQAMILGNSSYRYDLEFAGTPIDINNHLKILGICFDNNLSFTEQEEDITETKFSVTPSLF